MGLTMCFTGHRQIVPQMHQGSPWPDQNSIILNYHRTFIDTLTGYLRQYCDMGYDEFISGGALGADQLAAKAVINLKREGRHARLIIAKPFPSQDCKWPAQSRQALDRICKLADEVKDDISPDPYAPWKMQVRNEWMVDHSAAVCAIWNGKRKGGTWNCLQYAIKQNKPLVRVDPHTFEASNILEV